MSRGQFTETDLREALRSHADPSAPALPATERARSAQRRAVAARRRTVAAVTGVAAAAVVGTIALQALPTTTSQPAPADRGGAATLSEPPRQAANGTLVATLRGDGAASSPTEVTVPAGTPALRVAVQCPGSVAPTASPDGTFEQPNPLLNVSALRGASSLADGGWLCGPTLQVQTVGVPDDPATSWWAAGETSTVTVEPAETVTGPYQLAIYAVDPRWGDDRAVLFPKEVHGLVGNIAMDGGPGATSSDIALAGTRMTVVLRCAGTGTLTALVDGQPVATQDCDGSLFDETVVDVPADVAASVMSPTPTHTFTSTWTGDPATRTALALYWG